MQSVNSRKPSEQELQDIDKDQATLNIGLIGHVANGKSTLVKAISGLKTTRFRKENIRSSTIKLGYANAKIFKCGTCEEPSCYQSFPSNIEEATCKYCSSPLSLKRHVSFVDCPGHEFLMNTMLNGAKVMDGALLLIAANEPCPQPQTLEHLAAIKAGGLKNIIIVQNKIDLLKIKKITQNYEDIRAFLKDALDEALPIIPIVAKNGINVDAVCQTLVEGVAIPDRELDAWPEMMIVRSFDINKAGDPIEALQGGIAGGSLKKGVLRVNDQIEIRPGVVEQGEVSELPEGHEEYLSEGDTVDSVLEQAKFKGYVNRPIIGNILSIKAEQNSLKLAVPGGLIAIGTDIDPAFTRADRLVGQVLGVKGHLPKVFRFLELELNILKRAIGCKEEDREQNEGGGRLKRGHVLLLNVGAMCSRGFLLSRKKKNAKVFLETPVCTQEKERVSVSRQFTSGWRLIGSGLILKGC